MSDSKSTAKPTFVSAAIVPMLKQGAKDVMAGSLASGSSTSVATSAQNSAPPTSSSAIVKGSSGSISIWVPMLFNPDNQVIYLLSATHRGDMYHIRAAMALEPHPLCLYDCPAKPNDLIAYLRRSLSASSTRSISEDPKTYFQTASDWKVLAGQSAPSPEYRKATFPIISESGATDIVSAHMSMGTSGTIVTAAMAIIDAKATPNVEASMDKILRAIFPPQDPNKKTVLVLHRDTGTQPGGHYPELDSGAAMEQIASLITKTPPSKDGKQLQPLLCGNKQDISDIPSINEYWTKLPTGEFPGQTKRDIEALFLQKAFKENYFAMVVGFRSGVLDLFTFLGVPTVSIGLRNLVGEARHAKLAKAEFRRQNIQYLVPRHPDTKWFKGAQSGRLLGSPFWKFAPASTPASTAPMHEPGPLAPYDFQVVRTGLRVAIQRYLAWESTSFIAGNMQRASSVFDASSARRGYPSELVEGSKDAREAKKTYYEQQQKLEMGDFERLKGLRAQMGGSEQDYQREEEAMKRDWSARVGGVSVSKT